MERKLDVCLLRQGLETFEQGAHLRGEVERLEGGSVDFVKMNIHSHETVGNPDCPYCRARDFLLLKESCRLNRPFLGKRDEFT